MFAKYRRIIEWGLHLFFWIFIFSSINVDWSANWWDPSLRPNTPAPLSVIIFPLFFYANAFWLIPRFLNLQKWPIYLLFCGVLFGLPEFLRIGVLSIVDSEINFTSSLFSRDSFLFGAPSSAWFSLNLSLGYRFTLFWFAQPRPTTPKHEVRANNQEASSAHLIIPPNEAFQLIRKLESILQEEKPHLNNNLTLRDLAQMLGITDKKLSTLLNQHLQIGFVDFGQLN